MVRLKTLVVVDMQNDFITGVFGTDEAKAIVGRVQSIIEDYINDEKSYTNIICTQDTHFEDTWDSNVESNLPAHCFIGTEGYELIEPIKYLIGDLIEADKTLGGNQIKVINKFTFGSIKVGEAIEEYYEYFTKSLNKEGVPNNQIKMEIEIVGLCTDICVISNALLLKAMLPYVEITVNSWACAGTTPENHNKALDIMKLNGIKIVGE